MSLVLASRAIALYVSHLIITCLPVCDNVSSSLPLTRPSPLYSIADGQVTVRVSGGRRRGGERMGGTNAARIAQSNEELCSLKRRIMDFQELIDNIWLNSALQSAFGWFEEGREDIPPLPMDMQRNTAQAEHRRDWADTCIELLVTSTDATLRHRCLRVYFQEVWL